MKRSGLPRMPIIMMTVMLIATLVFLVVTAITGSRGARGIGRTPGTKILEVDSINRLTDPATRDDEIRRLAASRKVEAAPILRQFTKDKDAELRRMCVWGLGEIGFAESVFALRILVEDPDLAVRLETVRGLGKLYDAAKTDTSYKGDRAMLQMTAMEALEDLVADPDPMVRVEAARVLGGKVADAKPIELLVGALNDKTVTVRVAAAESLDRGTDGRVHPGLIQALRDESPAVRLVAARSLAARDGGDVSAALGRAMIDPDGAVRAAVAQGVRRIGKPVLPTMYEVLPMAPNMASRREAFEVLRSIGGVESAPCLLRLLQNLDPRGARSAGAVSAETDDLRKAVVGALRAMGPEVLKPVEEVGIAGGGGLMVKQAAAEVCEGLGAPAAAAIARYITTWKLFPDDEELAIWVRTLGVLGDPVGADALDRAMAQGVQGMPELVAEARRRIERTSGKTLAPLRPSFGLPRAAESGYEFPRKPAQDMSYFRPATAADGGLPADGEISLVLKGSILRGYTAQRSSADMEVTLSRADGRWLKDVRGEARRFNQSEHEGVVVRHEEKDGRQNLRIEMVVKDDPWVKGGFGEYDVALFVEGNRWSATYAGRYDYQDVTGPVEITIRRMVPGWNVRKPLAQGEHPRMLFRTNELPIVWARAQTEFGRAIIGAVRRKVAAARRAGPEGVDPVGAGFLYAVFGDREYGRMALPGMRSLARAFEGVGHPHDIVYSTIPMSLAFDMVYDCLTEEERTEFTSKMRTTSNIMNPQMGLLGNFNNTKNSNWTALGCGGAGMMTLACLREKGSIGVSPPQGAFEPVTDIAADSGVKPAPGVPLNGFEPGRMMRNWLLNGPFADPGGEHPLSALGGCAAARPVEGTRVSYRGGEFPFTSLPSNCVRTAAGVGRTGERIALPASRETSRSYLYGLLRVDEVRGAVFDCSFPAGFQGCNIWVSGRQVGNGSVVILQPGFHPVLLEVTGGVVSPALHPANAHFLYGQYQRSLQMRDRFAVLQAAYDRTGEMQDVPINLNTVKLRTNQWWSDSMGDHGWGSECGYGHKYPNLLPFTVFYETATGESLAAGTGIPWMLPLSMMASCSSGSYGVSALTSYPIAMFMHLTAPEYLPSVVWKFNQMYLPDKLDQLNCQQLAMTFMNYPLNVAPVHPEQNLPKVWEDEVKGGYVFRNHFDRGDDDILSILFLRSYPGSSYYYPQAGSFRIYGLGASWAVGVPGSKRDWRYAQENVLYLRDNNGPGLGKKTYFVSKPDGSGIVGADMAGVYTGRNARNPSSETTSIESAERHFAVDYGGSAGVPAVFAVVDRVNGGPSKHWLLHAGGSGTDRTAGPLSVAVDGRTFTLSASSGATLRGVVVSPADATLLVGGVVEEFRDAKTRLYSKEEIGPNTLQVTTKASSADYFVVMTLQKGKPPALDVRGQGLGSVVKVGGQEVRFRDGRLAFGAW